MQDPANKDVGSTRCASIAILLGLRRLAVVRRHLKVLDKLQMIQSVSFEAKFSGRLVGNMCSSLAHAKSFGIESGCGNDFRFVSFRL